ncbi:MAG: DUF5958 family protein [Tannerellaceae bacterium]|nr:DUF5958 family protein [Tannerellaceae bacterium]
MTFQEELLINKFGQDLVDQEEVRSYFCTLEEESRRRFLRELTGLIFQSKPQIEDIGPAIKNSGLKPTYTPCVLIKQGLTWGNLEKIIHLPAYEMKKTLLLFIHLFRIAYQRRFQAEKNNPDKWWYWDFTDKDNLIKATEKNTLDTFYPD